MFIVTLMLVGRVTEVVREIGEFDTWQQVVAAIMADIDEELFEDYEQDLNFTERECDWTEDGVEFWDIGSDEMSYTVRRK